MQWSWTISWRWSGFAKYWSGAPFLNPFGGLMQDRMYIYLSLDHNVIPCFAQSRNKERWKIRRRMTTLRYMLYFGDSHPPVSSSPRSAVAIRLAGAIVEKQNTHTNRLLPAGTCKDLFGAWGRVGSDLAWLCLEGSCLRAEAAVWSAQGPEWLRSCLLNNNIRRDPSQQVVTIPSLCQMFYH